MGIWGDYHSHSVYSHGKGSVEDNVKRAVEIGLKEIGITDHGVIFYPNNLHPEKVDDFLNDINACREKYPQINIYAGVESNLYTLKGDMDLPEEYADKLDYVICGYHNVRMIMAHPRDMFTLWLPNVTERKNPKRIVKNTDAYIKAMDRYRISVIAHPLKGLSIDLKALSEAAKEKNVYIEVNEKNLTLKPQDFEAIMSTGCGMVLSSDAHCAENVGIVTNALALSRQAGVPDEAYANREKFPDFNFRPGIYSDRSRFR